MHSNPDTPMQYISYYLEQALKHYNKSSKVAKSNIKKALAIASYSGPLVKTIFWSN